MENDHPSNTLSLRPPEDAIVALKHGPARIRAAQTRVLDIAESVAEMKYRRDSFRASMLLALQSELEAAQRKTNAEQREAMLMERLATDPAWTSAETSIKTGERLLKVAALDVDFEQDSFRAALGISRLLGTGL